MTSRNRTPRCPVSTRYSRPDAKSPGSASPEMAGLLVDMLDSLIACSPASGLRPAVGTIDIGQGEELSFDAHIGNKDDCRSDLQDGKNQHEESQHARMRHACKLQSDPGQQ